jgi:DNA-binding MarR family transcriptional regulator
MSENFSKAIAYKIHKAVFVMDKLADSTLQSKVDLTLSQFLLLMTIIENPNLKQIEVANFLELTQAAVSRQIEVLRNKKLIIVEINQENRRENFLNPTPLGNKIFTQSSEILHEKFENLYKVITEKDKENLEKSLDKLLFSFCGKRRSINC